MGNKIRDYLVGQSLNETSGQKAGCPAQPAKRKIIEAIAKP